MPSASTLRLREPTATAPAPTVTPASALLRMSLPVTPAPSVTPTRTRRPQHRSAPTASASTQRCQQHVLGMPSASTLRLRAPTATTPAQTVTPASDLLRMSLPVTPAPSVTPTRTRRLSIDLHRLCRQVLGNVRVKTGCKERFQV